MSLSPAKFTFDLDLGNRPVKEETEPQQVLSDAALEMLLANARQEGFDRGFAEGETGALARQAQGMTIAAQAIASQVQVLLGTIDNAQAESLRNSVELATSVGRKLATHLIAAQPTVELQALIEECFASLEGVPHLVIRCHPDVADKVREIATERMKTSSFAGRLVVMGDPELPLGDGRLEWVDGGLVRSIDEISAQIDDRILSYLAAHGAAPAAQHDTHGTDEDQ